MLDVFKPYFAKTLDFLVNQRIVFTLTIILTITAWFYADIFLNKPLNRHEVIGFFLLIFAISYLFRNSYKYIKSLFRLFVFILLLYPFNRAEANNLRIVLIPATGEHFIDLKILSLFQFQFPLNELQRIDEQTLSESEIDCLTYKRYDHDDFKAIFCGYDQMFNSSTASIIADTKGNTAYAWDLYELRIRRRW